MKALDALKLMGIGGDIVETEETQLADVVLLRPTKTLAQINWALKEAYKFGYTSAEATTKPEKAALEILFFKNITSAKRTESELKRFKNFVVPLGVSPKGFVTHDFKRDPHLLIAGGTGSGKTSFLHNLLFHLIKTNDCYIIPIDFKGTELPRYEVFRYPESAAHATDAVGITAELVDIMERRYEIFRRNNVKDVEEFNEKVSANIKHIFLVIDELADAMVRSGDKRDALEMNLVLLAQKARAAGIHLILATQRPTVDIVTGTIKANIATRVALKMATKTDSKVILDEDGAETLQPRYFYYKGTELVRGVSFTTDMKKIDKFLGSQFSKEADYSLLEYVSWKRKEIRQGLVEMSLVDGEHTASEYIQDALLFKFNKGPVSLWDIIAASGFRDPNQYVPEFANAAIMLADEKTIKLVRDITAETNWFCKEMVSKWMVTWNVSDKQVVTILDDPEEKAIVSRYMNTRTLGQKVDFWKKAVKSFGR
jgi:hypothetical protein